MTNTIFLLGMVNSFKVIKTRRSQRLYWARKGVGRDSIVLKKSPNWLRDSMALESTVILSVWPKKREKLVCGRKEKEGTACMALQRR